MARSSIAGLCMVGALAMAGCATWVPQSTPNPPSPTGNTLASISCPAVDACLAVGLTNPNGIPSPLAERWDGRTWTVLPSINIYGAQGGRLGGVSCSAPDACTAVGTSFTSAGVTTSFAARWNGSAWALQAIPGPEGSVGTALGPVSCPRVDRCVAVGIYYRPAGRFSVPVTLAEHWDGSSWTIQPTPSPSTGDFLSGVSCALPDACTAVGWFNNGGREAPLALRWNGNTWQQQTLPTASDAVATRLEGVSCPTQLLCTAVGTTQTETLFEPLVERWSDGQWAVQPSPAPTTGASQLLEVSCPTSTQCSAVGTRLVSPQGAGTALAERWSGAKWAIEPTFLPSDAQFGWLNGVSCATDTACTSVGYSGVQGGVLRTLALVRREVRPGSQ